MRGNLLVEKSKAFALKGIELYKRLLDAREHILSKQFLRSSTSIGANIAEGQYAQSKADFLSKYSIALKEASETLYWLDLLSQSGWMPKSADDSSLVADCEELIRLLVASIKTVKEKK